MSDSQPIKKTRYGITEAQVLVPWDMLSFDEKILSILRSNKVDVAILQTIKQQGGPVHFGRDWWEQTVFAALPACDVDEITELLAKRQAFEHAWAENPEFAAKARQTVHGGYEQTVQQMFQHDWNNPLMLEVSCRMVSSEIAAVLRKRIRQLDSFCGIPRRVWYIAATILIGMILLSIFGK